MWKLVGNGINAGAKEDAIGACWFIRTMEETFSFYEKDVSGGIALTPTASVTILSPIISRLSGMICLKGSRSAHLAILAREFQVPCIVSANFDVHIGDINGKKVKMACGREDGLIYLEE